LVSGWIVCAQNQEKIETKLHKFLVSERQVPKRFAFVELKSLPGEILEKIPEEFELTIIVNR
jgi:hypothetical protein